MRPESRETGRAASPPEALRGRGAPLISEFEQDGFRLAFSVSGRGGDDLVFIHGLYSSATAGLPLADALSAGRRVWAPDLPGHGASGPFPGQASVEESARALSLFIRAHCDPPVRSLIGYSMGCVVALRLASAEPELVQSLTLIAGPANPGRIPLWARGLASRAFCRPTGAMMAAGIRVGELVRRVLFRRSDLLRILLSGAAAADRRATIGMVQSASRLDPEQLTRPLGDTPCLVLSGTRDTIVRPFHAMEMQRLLPHARMHWLSGADHLAPYTDAERVARYINSFLRRI